MLENIAPIWPGKVGLYTRPGYDVNPILCMVKSLEHHNEGRTGVTLLVHTRAMVMKLDHTIFVLLRHLVHHPSEPLKRAFLPGDPIEVGSLCHECLLGFVATSHISFQCSILLDVIQHIFKYAYQWSRPDAEPDEEEDVVVSIVLRRSTIGAIDPKFRKPNLIRIENS